MIMSTVHFRSETGIRLQSAFMSKKSSDELIAIHGDLNSLEGGTYPKFDPQARWKFMIGLAGKCEAYLKEKEHKGRNLANRKHRCIDELTTQLVRQMSKEMTKADMYGNKVTQYDRVNGAIPMGRNNPHHGKVKFELALGGKTGGPVVNGQSLWTAASDAGIQLSGNDTQDAYILRSWLKHLARQNKLKKLTAIEYADSEQRKKYLLSFSATTCAQGAAPFDTTSGYTIGEEGAGPFVISDGGEWYAKAGNFNAKAGFHHSSFLSGAPVMLAGTVRVAGGTLQYISNNSGHYAPRIADLLNGANQIRHCGLDSHTRHKVSILCADFEGRYSQVAGAQFLFPYTSFVRLHGNVPNPGNYGVDAVHDILLWKNPAAPRPEHRATVGQQIAEGVPVVFPA